MEEQNQEEIKLYFTEPKVLKVDEVKLIFRVLYWAAFIGRKDIV